MQILKRFNETPNEDVIRAHLFRSRRRGTESAIRLRDRRRNQDRTERTRRDLPIRRGLPRFQTSL